MANGRRKGKAGRRPVGGWGGGGGFPAPTYHPKGTGTHSKGSSNNHDFRGGGGRTPPPRPGVNGRVGNNDFIFINMYVIPIIRKKSLNGKN